MNPTFFQMIEQFDEFERLTAVAIKEVFFKEAVEQSAVLYELFTKKKKKTSEKNYF